MALHLECVPEPAQCLARQLFPAVAQHCFVLAGGTALALQLGHRVSLDFDFFIGKSLAYFADADHDPEPVYRGPAIAWETIRQFFRSRAPTFTRRMIDAAPSG